MKEKNSKLFHWGLGTYQIVMKNKIVSTGCFLIPGYFYLFCPEGSLRWDTGMLSLMLMLCAVASIVFILTDKNEKTAKGKELADGLVQGFFNDRKNIANMERELFPKNEKLQKHEAATSERFDKGNKKLFEKHKRKLNRSKAGMLIYYSLLLILGIVMFIRRDEAIYLTQIIIGILLVIDGFTGIASISAAYKSGIPIKDKTLSLVLSIATVIFGIAFIILTWSTAVVMMRTVGALLIIKVIVEFYVMIRNREILSLVKDTIQEIKEQ